jgi:tetratricopeptide (TPR) repeat protein
MSRERRARSGVWLSAFGGRLWSTGRKQVDCNLLSAKCKSLVGALCALILVLPAVASAQVDQMPEAGYYVAVNEFYGGQFRDAERALRRMTRTGVQANQARWIDSVCYHAMLGEVLYQQGRNAEALASFDQACLLLLSYPDFMRRVTFENPRQEGNPQRIQVPWGAGTRRFTLGNFPRSMQIAVGSITGAQQAMQSGGTFMQAQYWRLNVAEVVRTAALAMRRRNELLGPLGKHDRVSKELATAMSRRNLTVANHWSQSWTELLAGIAKAGIGDAAEAKTRLERAVIVGGTFDSPLSGVALLELGKLQMAAGDAKSAGQLLLDASVTAYAYDDLNVVNDALRLGWVNHLASGAGGMYPPLEPAAAWAQGNRLWFVAATLRLAQAENLLRGGQVAGAATLVEEIGRRLGDMRAARVGMQHLFLQAVVQVGRGQVDLANGSLNKALAGQRIGSLRNFQIVRATELCDAGEMTARVAPDVFAQLLSDPTPADWTQRLFDTLAVISTPHGPAFDRWFLAAIERKDVAAAIEISERAKRARFLTSLPLGGRLLALRAVLEAPASELSPQATIERQQLGADFPEYGSLAAAGAQLAQQIRAGSLKPEAGAAGQVLVQQLDQWNKNVTAREQMLLAMALAPVPTTMMFPPLRTTAELKQSLGAGEALVVFHMAGGNLYGFLVSRQTEHVWLLGEAQQVQKVIAEWLRALGNYSASREMGGEELASGEWRELAEKMWLGLFADARLDLAKTTDLAIVPDGWLWYLPFEALVPPAEKGATGSNAGAGTEAMLIERVPVHYAPTAALAVGDRRAFRPTKHTGIVANTLAAAEAKAKGDGAEGLSLAPLEDAVTGPVRLVPPLVQPGYLYAPLLDQLVVLDDVEVNRIDPFGWSPIPKSRGKNADSLTAWMGLPYEGPERVVLTGIPTAAETGLKGPTRRGGDAATAAPGSEVFSSVCALMASGARTVLVSRWRTGGQMNLQLVREFVQELQAGAGTPADVAWQRSVMLAWETPLDASQEPRMKRLAEDVETPGANHPFFWAGYMLVDTGTGGGGAEAETANPPDAKPGGPDSKPKAAGTDAPAVMPPQSELKPAGDASIGKPPPNDEGDYE